jgi:hypothetical protein
VREDGGGDPLLQLLDAPESARLAAAQDERSYSISVNSGPASSAMSAGSKRQRAIASAARQAMTPKAGAVLGASARTVVPGGYRHESG